MAGQAVSRALQEQTGRAAEALHLIRPLDDLRWPQFVHQHPRASVFHSRAWLQALHRTYALDPIAYTTSAPEEALRDAVLICRVNSWLTGRRIVSLPFSDHCSPLIDDVKRLEPFVERITQTIRDEQLRYFEIRPMEPLACAENPAHSAMTYGFHQIDLRPDLDVLFKNLHKDSTQRKIRRAEREGLLYEEGHTEVLLAEFCRLNLLTRRRHGIPPQPVRWFWNLLEAFGQDLKIRVAYQGSRSVAAILTLRHKDTLVYKYGASDNSVSNLGGTHLLFWKAIQEAKTEGLLHFDLGRSSIDNAGLLTFKDRWGAARSTLTYSRFTELAHPEYGYVGGEESLHLRLAKRVFARMPDRMFSWMGDLFYRHIG